MTLTLFFDGEASTRPTRLMFWVDTRKNELEQSNRMFIAKLLLVISLLFVYLTACFFLLADSFPPLWGMLFVTLHMLYSGGIIWAYAYLKVQNGSLAILLIPMLLTTSTLGIAIWIVFRPEATLRKRLQ